MTDRIDVETRRRIMAAVGQKHTRPELKVRSAVHGLGYRFRLHRKDLPGSPDLVLPAHRLVIFVHGCFWHRHPGCRKTTSPSANREFWQDKFKANMERDERNRRALRRRGWRVEIVWGCETEDPSVLLERLSELLPPKH